MIRKVVVFIIIAVVGFACESDNKTPENLIQKNEMALILTDMMLLEATYNTRLIRVSDKTERMLKYSEEIINHHNVTKESFDISYEYYMDHPEDFEMIMEQVFEELNKLETEASKYNEVEIETEQDKDSTIVVE